MAELTLGSPAQSGERVCRLRAVIAEQQTTLRQAAGYRELTPS